MEASKEEALVLFCQITGAQEAQALQALENHSWEMNAAVNSYMEHQNDLPGPSRVPRGVRVVEINDDDEEVGEDMEVDGETTADLQSGNSREAAFQASPASAFGHSGNLSLLLPATMKPATPALAVPRETMPSNVREVPIAWTDRDDEPRYSAHHYDDVLVPRTQPSPQRGLLIEELPVGPPGDANTSEGCVSLAANGDDDGSDADEDADATDSNNRNSIVSPRAEWQLPQDRDWLDAQDSSAAGGLAHRFDMAGYGGDRMVSVEGSPYDDNTEEAMIRAAMEASLREAQAGAGRAAVFDEQLASASAGVGDRASRPMAGPGEDDEVARALALSIQTAEEEAEMRRRLGSDSSNSDDAAADWSRLQASASQRGDISGEDPAHPWPVQFPASGMASNNLQSDMDADEEEDEDDEDDTPLMRRRSSAPSAPPLDASATADADADLGAGKDKASLRSQGPSEPPAGISGEAGLRDSGGAGYGDGLHNELSGISAEERETAAMYEAAIFGVPYVASNPSLNGVPGRGISSAGADTLPQEVGQGTISRRIGNFTSNPVPHMEGPVGGLMDYRLGYGGFYEESDDEDVVPRNSQAPTSPAVIAQRLLREQQDDEYLASLAADREKELKVQQQEEEGRRLARLQEELEREQQLLHLRAAEDLERQLAAKRDALPSEPPQEDNKAVTILVRLPDGNKRHRRFRFSDKLQALFDFIDIGGGVAPGSYKLVRQYPRSVLQPGRSDQTLEELGLTSRQEAFFLELD